MEKNEGASHCLRVIQSARKEETPQHRLQELTKIHPPAEAIKDQVQKLPRNRYVLGVAGLPQLRIHPVENGSSTGGSWGRRRQNLGKVAVPVRWMRLSRSKGLGGSTSLPLESVMPCMAWTP